MTVHVGQHRRSGVPSLRAWVAACAAAEAVGIAAAAGAARLGRAVVGGEPSGGREVLVVVGLAVAAGLVEGSALGVLQGRWLAGRLDGAAAPFRRDRWLLVTLVVAGLGWAAGSTPAALAGDSGDSAEPPLLLVLLGAAAIGVVLGTLLGAAQSAVLRGTVRHPGRWVLANALAWPPAMVVIFLGAASAGAGWPAAAVVLLGAATGLVAGAVLGAVTALLLPSLDGPRPRDSAVLVTLGSPARRVLGRGLVGLRLTGRRTGRTVELPVQYARHGRSLVVLPGRPEQKTWWRNLDRPAPVEVLLDGNWRAGVGQVLRADDDGHAAAVSSYQQRWPHARVPADALVVLVALADAG